MRIVVECRACGHEREVERRAVIAGTWKRQPCPACGRASDGIEVECGCGYVSIETPDAIAAGIVTPCPGCGGGDD